MGGGGGGGQALWDKIPNLPKKNWTSPFRKARAPGRLASREERNGEKRAREKGGGRHFPMVFIP